MKRAISRNWRTALTIGAFAALSTVLGFYMLLQQRLQLPFTPRYQVHLYFAATPDSLQGSASPPTLPGSPSAR